MRVLLLLLPLICLVDGQEVGDEDLLLFGDAAPVVESVAPTEEDTEDVLDKTKDVSVSNKWDPADNITTLVNRLCLAFSDYILLFS